MQFCHQLSPACKSCFSIFDSQPLLAHALQDSQRDIIIAHQSTFLSLTLHANKNCARTHADIFSITVYVFRNFFWKICSLLRQISITCLKCSKASFSPSSLAKRCAGNWVGFDVGGWRHILGERTCFLGGLGWVEVQFGRMGVGGHFPWVDGWVEVSFGRRGVSVGDHLF